MRVMVFVKVTEASEMGSRPTREAMEAMGSLVDGKHHEAAYSGCNLRQESSDFNH